MNTLMFSSFSKNKGSFKIVAFIDSTDSDLYDLGVCASFF